MWIYLAISWQKSFPLFKILPIQRTTDVKWRTRYVNFNIIVLENWKLSRICVVECQSCKPFKRITEKGKKKLLKFNLETNKKNFHWKFNLGLHHLSETGIFFIKNCKISAVRSTLQYFRRSKWKAFVRDIFFSGLLFFVIQNILPLCRTALKVSFVGNYFSKLGIFLS